VQKVQPAIEPMDDARSEGEVLAAIGAALGLAGFDGSFDPHEVSKAMSDSVTAFANASLATVGDGGAPLSKGGA
jgi:hypothetical protein